MRLEPGSVAESHIFALVPTVTDLDSLGVSWLLTSKPEF